MEKTPAQTQPHVLIFPLPLQGPVNSMFKLAELLCLSNIHVTFLVTEHIHSRLIRFTDVQSRFQRYPGFSLETISDGLPEDHPRGDKFMELFDSLRINTKPLFKKFLMSCTRPLIQSGELPFDGDDLDAPIKSVAGTEDFLRRRDLPSFCRLGDLSHPNVQLYKSESEENPRAYGLILNTFDDLEGPILAQLHEENNLNAACCRIGISMEKWLEDASSLKLEEDKLAKAKGASSWMDSPTSVGGEEFSLSQIILFWAQFGDETRDLQ
ncbi:hypothetical protein POM88_040505 [Heracleum sosnowskyi]|uniref:Uncharacterized protein n=1 Tax=Heracleum sosnowskyi TaxID=360622 RepID=A0AAD8HD34_9APIA|nr:hypothetical protein POM88_040505 [Heracleum sosnowskyi]